MVNINVIEDNSLQQLLSHIVLKYLAKLYCICVIWKSEDIEQISNMNILISDVNWQTITDPPTLIWLNYQENNQNFSEIDRLTELGINAGCQAFIVSTGITFEFLASYDKVRFVAKNRYHNIHVVILQPICSNKSQKMDLLGQILNQPVINDIPNCLVITSSELENTCFNTFDLTTSKFVGRFDNTKPLLLDTYNGRNSSFIENSNLFPNKMTNLHQRVVRMALFNYKPYAIWVEVPPGQGNANAVNTDKEKTLLVDGTESLMLLEFCFRYNCTLEVSLDEEGEWGIIYDNSTGDGVLGAVAERRADIGFTALYSWHHEFQFLDFSAAITRSGITCICPKPKLLGGWVLPAMPFKLAMWLGVLFSFLGVNVALIAFRYYDNRMMRGSVGYTILQVWATFILQSTNFLNRNLPEMIVFGCALIISLLIASAYGGGLASIMTIPHYEAPIDTVHQLAARNMEWGATHDAWIFSILLATQPDIKKLVQLFRPIPVEQLAKRTTSQDFAFSVERLPYGHYAVGEYIDENALKYLQIMPNDIYYEYCVAMSYKTWPFKSVHDLLILRVAETGIQNYWELQTVIKHNNNKIQLGIAISRHRENQGPVSLQPTHVVGVFILWILGIIVSFIAFIAEIIIFKYLHQN